MRQVQRVGRVGVKEGAQGDSARTRVPLGRGDGTTMIVRMKKAFSVVSFAQLSLADLGVVRCNLKYSEAVHACGVCYRLGWMGCEGVLGQSIRKGLVVRHNTIHICVEAYARVFANN